MAIDTSTMLTWIGITSLYIIGAILAIFFIALPFRYFYRIHKFTCFLLDAEALYPGRILKNGFPKSKKEVFKIYYGVMITRGWQLFTTLEGSTLEYRYYNCKYSVHKGARHG